MTDGTRSNGRLICLVPNPSIDRTAVVDRLVVGEIHRPREVVAVAGGKGLNVARAARALGVPVSAVVVLAGHAGRWIDDELVRLRLPHEAVWGRGETRTCVSVLDRSSNQLTEVYEPGPSVSDTAWRRFERLARQTVRATPGPLVALSGSLPPGIAPASAGDLVRAARAAGGRVLVDTSGEALLAAIAAEPMTVKVNAAEAAIALERRVETEDEALAAARELTGLGAERAVITRGAFGAVGWDGIVGWAVDPPKGAGSHGVGAGDAFLAGLAAAIRRGERLDACLRRAAAAAAASTLVAGPGNLARETARRLLRATSVRRLG
jgi:1-phosphofructokinase family hexose kinase